MSFFTIRKPGQGKVARLASGVGFGIVLLGTVFWIISEVNGAFSHLQAVRTTYGVIAEDFRRMTQAGSPSLTVTAETARAIQDLHGEALGAGETVRVRVRPQGGRQATTLLLTKVDVAPTAAPGSMATLELAQAPRRDLDRNWILESSDSRNHLVYLTGGLAVILVLGSLGILFLILNRPRIVDFLIATEDEMRKVNWPSRREVIGATWVVIMGTFIMAAALWVVDLIFAELFITIGILEGNSTLAAMLRWLFPG